MRLNEIAPEAFVEILIRRNSYNYRIVSQVLYRDVDCIGVTPIASSQRMFRFKDTDEITIIYRNEDCYWKWDNVRADIATREDGDQIHVFYVSGKGIMFNRRSQFRFNIEKEISLKYMVLDTSSDLTGNSEAGSVKETAYRLPELELENVINSLDERYREVECKAFLKDLSEGGASVETDVILEKGAIVSFELDSDDGVVALTGVIVRVTENRRGYYDYSYGCSFTQTGKNYIKYFYAQQRKRLYESRNSDK